MQRYCDTNVDFRYFVRKNNVQLHPSYNCRFTKEHLVVNKTRQNQKFAGNNFVFVFPFILGSNTLEDKTSQRALGARMFFVHINSFKSASKSLAQFDSSHKEQNVGANLPTSFRLRQLEWLLCRVYSSKWGSSTNLSNNFERNPNTFPQNNFLFLFLNDILYI